MARTGTTDNIGALATDAAERIRWEAEHAAPGYRSFTGTPVETVVSPPPKTAPSPTRPEPTPDPTPSRPPVEAHGSDISAEDALQALRTAIGECTRCGLSSGRTHLVFGEGNPRARLVFVGEGPGRDEDQSGRPFVGAAGQLLDRIIEAMGLSRSDVYICNVIKCRPPENRTPNEGEQSICGPFVRRQLDIIGPEVIVALGGTAAKYLLETEAPVGKLRGRFHAFKEIPVLPTYHPAYLLRTPSAKRAVWDDMQMVMAKMGLKKKQEGSR